MLQTVMITVNYIVREKTVFTKKQNQLEEWNVEMIVGRSTRLRCKYCKKESEGGEEEEATDKPTIAQAMYE
jgi:hypothetical protein